MSDYTWILALLCLVSAIIGILEALSDCFKQRNVSKNNKGGDRL